MFGSNRFEWSAPKKIAGAIHRREFHPAGFANVDQKSLATAVLKLAIKAIILSSLFCLIAAAQTASTSTRLIVSPVSASAGDAVTLTAAVESAGSSVNGGRVTFYDGLTPIGTVEVVGNTPATGYVTGTAVLVTAFLPGSYSLVARFLGTPTFEASTSQPVQIEVTGAIPSSTSLELGSNNAPYSFVETTTGDSAQPLAGTIELLDKTSSNILDTLPIAPSQLMSGLNRQSPAPVGKQPVALVSADFNHDGIPDIAVANYAAGTVSILLGGGGGYTLAQTLQVGAGPCALAIADFNGDGIPDLAVVNSRDDDVVIFMGDPDHPGYFSTLGRSTKVGFAPVALTVDDFNGDGIPDIAVANFWGNSVTVMMGDPSDPGTFMVSQTVSVGQGPIAIASADLNGDGVQDIAVANFNDNTVWVLAGDPLHPGQFISPQYVSATGLSPTSLAIADLNDDGLPDLVVSNSGDSTVSVLWGTKGQNGVFPTQEILQAGNDPQSVAVGDFNGDGLVDIAVVNSGDGNVGVLLNGGNGTFQSQQTYPIGLAPRQLITLSTLSGASPGLATVDENADVSIALRNGSTFSGTFTNQSITGSGTHQLEAEYLPGSGSGYGRSTSNSISIDLGTVAAGQTISFPSLNPVVYGAPPIDLNASASSGLPVSYKVVSGPGALQGNQLSVLGAGSIVVEADQSGNGTYSVAAAVQQTLQVAKAYITLTPNNAQRIFGQPNPIFGGSISGVVAGDEITATYSSSAGPTTPVGTYSQPPNGISASLEDPKNRLANYTVKNYIGTLTILPAGGNTGYPILHTPLPHPIGPSPLPPIPPLPQPPGSPVPIKPISPPPPLPTRPIGSSPLPPISPAPQPPDTPIPVEPITPVSPAPVEPIDPAPLPPIAPIPLPPGPLPLPPINDPVKSKPKHGSNPSPIQPIVPISILPPPKPVRPSKPVHPGGPSPIHRLGPWHLPPIVPIPLPLPPEGFASALGITKDLLDMGIMAIPPGHHQHQQQRFRTQVFLAGPTRVMKSGDDLILSALVDSDQETHPTGNVMFWDNGQFLAASLLNPLGRSVVNVVLDGESEHLITATYAGDDQFQPAHSSTLKVVVGSPIGTLPGLLSSPKPSVTRASRISRVLAPSLSADQFGTSCKAEFPYMTCSNDKQPYACTEIDVGGRLSLAW